MSDEKAELRKIVKNNLSDIMGTLNGALDGQGLTTLEPVIKRLGYRSQLPHWYEEFSQNNTIVNRDGKTVGSVLELLLVAVLETGVLKNSGIKLRVSPARGIDLPDLDLGIKTPSKNYCTSEPFFSAYERLYGNEHDCLIILTDYQVAKASKDGFKIKAESWRYLRASEIADAKLCRIALKHRAALLEQDESTAKRVFQFLAYVNQTDWRGKTLLKLLDHMDKPADQFNTALAQIEKDFSKQNKNRFNKGRELIPDADLQALQKVFPMARENLGLTHQLDNWVTEFLKDAYRAPSENEWQRLRNGPLDGQIGMSFALQWRYNFGQLFGKIDDE